MKLFLLVALAISALTIVAPVRFVDAQDGNVVCSRPGDYINDLAIDVQPPNPTAQETFTTTAVFAFKPNFMIACYEKAQSAYYFKFVYDNYGGSQESLPKPAVRSGNILKASDIPSSWASLTDGVQPTSTTVRVRAFMYAVSNEGVPYENGSAVKIDSIPFQGITLNGTGGNQGGATPAPINGNPVVGGGGIGGAAAGTVNNGTADVGKTFYNPIDVDNIPAFIVKIIKILLFLSGMLAVLFVIIGGLRYIASQGNSTAMTTAKNTVVYALVGLALAILSYAIVNLITNVLINR